MLDGSVAEATCLYGTLLQETYAKHPALRAAAALHLEQGTKALTADLARAMETGEPRAVRTGLGAGRVRDGQGESVEDERRRMLEVPSDLSRDPAAIRTAQGGNMIDQVGTSIPDPQPPQVCFRDPDGIRFLLVEVPI